MRSYFRFPSGETAQGEQDFAEICLLAYAEGLQASRQGRGGGGGGQGGGLNQGGGEGGDGGERLRAESLVKKGQALVTDGKPFVHYLVPAVARWGCY